MIRRYPFDNILNFRDLGGYLASDGQMTAFHRVFRSGSLAYATPQEVERLKTLGIKTVIDFRGLDEVIKHPDMTSYDPYFTYHHLVVNGNGRIPTSEDDVIDSYMEMIEEPISAKAIFDTIADAEGAILIHCTAGKDRTGVYTAILLSLVGVDPLDIQAEYLLSFAYLRERAKMLMSKDPTFPHCVLLPNMRYMEEFLERFFAQFGSAERFLKTIGVNEENIQKIRAHFLNFEKN